MEQYLAYAYEHNMEFLGIQFLKTLSGKYFFSCNIY